MCSRDYRVIIPFGIRYSSLRRRRRVLLPYPSNPNELPAEESGNIQQEAEQGAQQNISQIC